MAKRRTKNTPTQSDSNVCHVPSKYVPSWLKEERTRVLTENVLHLADKNKDDTQGGCVVYWMQRDVRSVDNWALLFARHLAEECEVPLRVVHVLPSPSEQARYLPQKRMTERHASFLLGGLKCVQQELLSEYNVPLDILLCGDGKSVGESVCDFALCQQLEDHPYRAVAVVCDQSPLRMQRQWTEKEAAPLLSKEHVPLYQVDAHNIVPVWTASDKREVGARTLRPKINRLLPEYMTHFPALQKQNSTTDATTTIDWDACHAYLDPDLSVTPIQWAKPGTKAAMTQFQSFLTKGLKHFDTLRNDPNQKHICSNLSPWINHGHVSFQRLALDVRALNKHSNGTAAYIEEGVVRRELSDNYVYNTPENYDTLSAAAQWAQDSLQLHSSDTREYVYTREQLDMACTHDDLWNAAQIQLKEEAKMHGFLRMYWAKKILEWTPTPEIALSTAQYFNDKYALDGNDPNGFVGVGWSIMGIHDMGWKERDVFGKIRFMNYAGCKRKFKVQDFVQRYPPAFTNAQKAMADNNNSSSSTSSSSGGIGITTTAAKTSSSTKKRKDSSAQSEKASVKKRKAAAVSGKSKRKTG